MWRLGSGPFIELFKTYKNIKALCMCLSFRNPEHWGGQRGTHHHCHTVTWMDLNNTNWVLLYTSVSHGMLEHAVVLGVIFWFPWCCTIRVTRKHRAFVPSLCSCSLASPVFLIIHFLTRVGRMGSHYGLILTLLMIVMLSAGSSCVNQAESEQILISPLSPIIRRKERWDIKKKTCLPLCLSDRSGSNLLAQPNEGN